MREASTTDRRVLNVLVVEDRLAYSKTVFHAVKDAVDPDGLGRTARALDLLSHGELLANPGILAAREIDVMLLDAFETDRQRDNPLAPLYAALDVLEAVAAQPHPTQVVLYSQAIDDPAVHLIAREYDSVRALVAPDQLLFEMASVLWAKTPVGIRPPRQQDFDDLGIGPNASLRSALNAARGREDVWDLIVNGWTSTATHPRVRDFLNTTVRAHLDVPTPGYKAVVDVLQRIIGPPASSSAER